MKKIIISLVTFSAALATLSSCQREIENPVGHEMTVTVRAVPQVTAVPVKTYLGEWDGKDRVVLWGKGEQMQLAITSGGSTVFASSAPTDAYEGQPEASFSFTINPAGAAPYLYQGLYPASVVVSEGNTDPAGYKVVLPSEQNATAQAYDPAAYILVADPVTFDTKQTEWTAFYRRAVALNKLTLKGIPTGAAVNKVEITAPEGIALSGGRQINLSSGESGAIYDGSNSVCVNFATPLEGGADLVIWFTSWGAEFAEGTAFTVAASTTDSFTYSKEITVPSGHPLSFKEGWLNTFNVNMAGVVPDAHLFSGGLGTQANPWEIATVADLEAMAEYVASMEDEDMHFRTDFYKQTANIDFNGGTHSSIGNTNAAEPYSFFNGTYDGNGYKISNLVIANPNSNKAHGFFGYLDGAAHIVNLKIENATLTSTTWNDGIIVGCVQSTSTAVIENCSVTGTVVSAAEASVGGLVGKLMAGTMRGCSFQGSVSGTKSGKNGCGGIVGYSSGASCLIEDCHVLQGSTITGAANYVGGIVGQMDAGKILSCSVRGSDTSISGVKFVAGIVGYETNNANAREIKDCIVDCKEIAGTQGLVGGIVGDIEAPNVIDRCIVKCNLTNNSENNTYAGVGGIAGQVYCNGKNMVVSNCAYLGGTLANIDGNGSVAGIIGSLNVKVNGYFTLFNCCAFPTKILTGTTSNSRNLGGVVGWGKNFTLRNCYSPIGGADIYYNGTPVSDSNEAGGIYGWGSENGVIQDAYYISGFRAGKGCTNYAKSQQELTEAQMKGSGSVVRPSTAQSYSSFIETLNADASDWNAAPPQNVKAATWVIGDNGYPAPTGPEAADGIVRKKVSILGDSISTYQGFTPYPSNYQYPKSSCADFTNVSQTWWHQIIYDKMTNAKLEVNSSYTGTCVQETTDKGHPGYGFLHRYVELGDPDVILINGGTNDSWSFSLPVGTLDFSIATDNLDEFQFAQAYDKLIRLMKAKYPSAQIACIIGDNVMDQAYTAYAQVIRDVCEHYDLPYAQVVFADRAAMTYDNVHPNVNGMEEMANQIWNALKPSLEPGSDGIPSLEARIVNVDSPKMKVYLPPTNGKLCPLVVVCPGGGYSSIPGADGYEGAYYKDLFNEAGYALAVLYYTVPGGDSSKPTGDIEEALRLVRRRAGNWYVNADKVGVMGFSAGGHLASWAATSLTGNARADFQVLFYPVITMGEGTHAGSRTQLLGSSPTEAQIAKFSNEQHVSASTPRAFITYADNDTTVPPAYNGAAYYNALTAAGVPVQRCVYSNVTKPHGWHWGSFTFDGIAQNDGTKFEHLDEVKASLSTWLASF